MLFVSLKPEHFPFQGCLEYERHGTKVLPSFHSICGHFESIIVKQHFKLYNGIYLLI